MRAVVKCTKTDKDFSIEIPTTTPEVARYWRKAVQTKCPHCGDQHLESFQELYAQALMGAENWGEILDSPGTTPKRRLSDDTPA